MTVREYIGARYVPLFMGDWDSTATYEPLSIVSYQGNSYTSRQSVPSGIAITNDAYWALTGNYNAQIEAYRAEVQGKADITYVDDEIGGVNDQIALIEEKVQTKSELINAMTVSTGTMQKVWECIKTYLHNMGNIAFSTYSEGHNGWSYDTGPSVIVDEYGREGFAMNCSSFLHLILTGTPYEASMYNRNNGNVNEFGRAGYCFNMYGEAVTADNFADYMFVRQLAPRLDELGLVEYCAEDFSNIRTGDVLIFSNLEEKTLDSATHVGIVLGAQYGQYVAGSTRATILLAECYSSANVIRIAPVSCDQLVSRGVFATAHIPYQDVPIALSKPLTE